MRRNQQFSGGSTITARSLKNAGSSIPSSGAPHSERNASSANRRASRGSAARVITNQAAQHISRIPRKEYLNVAAHLPGAPARRGGRELLLAVHTSRTALLI